jgi:hypothetical protein
MSRCSSNNKTNQKIILNAPRISFLVPSEQIESEQFLISKSCNEAHLNTCSLTFHSLIPNYNSTVLIEKKENTLSASTASAFNVKPVKNITSIARNQKKIFSFL